MKRRVRILGYLLGTLSCFAAHPAAGQSDNPANAGIQFDFSLPGARSLALGGAFVGVADDATAAWTNPAGLLALTRPEVSIEGRGWEFANPFAERGHAFGNATGVGFDTITGVTEGSNSTWTGAPSFFSFVYPKGRFTFAGYRHQLQKFEANVASDGIFIRTTSPTPIFPDGAVDRDAPYTADLKISVTNYGGAAAVRLGRGFSAGMSLVVSDFSLESETNVVIYDPFNNFNGAVPPTAYTGLGQYYGPPNFAPERVYTRTQESGDDTALAVSAGLLWRTPDGKLSTGFAFRQGPTFTYNAQTVFGPAVRNAGNFANPGDVADTEEITYAVPHVYSVGAGFRPLEHILVSVEYDRVQYSRLSENNAEIFGVEESPFPGEKQKGELIRRSLYFDDSNQFRLGAEYAFVSSASTVALRMGMWIDPDHRMQFDREHLTAAERASIARIDVRYIPGDTAVHWTPGVGVTFPRFQIDAATDISEPTKTVSVSTVIRF